MTVSRQEEDEFTKTECYHYFHVACLARYVSYHRQLGAREGEGRREGRGHEREIKPKLLECPVCRETIAEGVLYHNDIVRHVAGVYIYM